MPTLNPFGNTTAASPAELKRKKPIVQPRPTAAASPFLPRKNNKFLLVFPANSYSRSAKALAKALHGTKSISQIEHVTTKGTNLDVINYGWAGFKNAGNLQLALTNARIINRPEAVSVVRDKMRFFSAMQKNKDGPRIPEFLTSLEEAQAHLEKKEIVLGRSKTGSCGTDIALFEDNPEGFAKSDFWVVYKKKRNEFRVHLFRFAKQEPEIIDVQKKVLRATDPVSNQPIDKSKVNFMVRSHRNGFIFQRNDITVPEDVKTQALKAFSATSLDFGAVDVIWNEHEGKAYVLEINSAPGLEGTTLDNYVSAFEKIL